jgi:hypothetical protein
MSYAGRFDNNDHGDVDICAASINLSMAWIEFD